MNDYLLLMHDDVRPDSTAASDADWADYLERLRNSGQFSGGSAIGAGACFRLGQAAAPISRQLTGYLRVRAENLEEARRFLAGNPVYEAGGTVEIRELPRD